MFAITVEEPNRPGLLSGSGQVLFRMCMVAPDWIPQASRVRSSLSLRPQCTSSDTRTKQANKFSEGLHRCHEEYILLHERHRCSGPIRSGSGMESGSCAATSCFKVATLYPPGGTSPGIISGKVKVDLGWSTSFKDSCQSVADISTLWIEVGEIRFKGTRAKTVCISKRHALNFRGGNSEKIRRRMET